MEAVFHEFCYLLEFFFALLVNFIAFQSIFRGIKQHEEMETIFKVPKGKLFIEALQVLSSIPDISDWHLSPLVPSSNIYCGNIHTFRTLHPTGSHSWVYVTTESNIT